MVIRFTRNTQAHLAKRERTYTKIQRTSTTPWQESHGDLKLDQFALTLDCTQTILTAKMDDTAMLDSGCTSIFLSSTAPCTSKKTSHIPLSVNIPNGTSIYSSHMCDLLITDLPPQAWRAHILSGLVHNLLISVGQWCDNRCDITFKKEAVSVMKDGKCLMLGSQDSRSDLWRVDLKKSKPAIKPACNHAHATRNQTELINYLHAA
jgi:hypothetical protein